MVAALTNLGAEQLPDDLSGLLSLIEQRVPAGVGEGHREVQTDVTEAVGMPASELGLKDGAKVSHQFGTLGSGNHFLEVCLDEGARVWMVLHSWSRGIGKTLAERHIGRARATMKRYFIELEDPDLAYVIEGTPDFDA
jgi:tRNA-splicing ligase RtcB